MKSLLNVCAQCLLFLILLAYSGNVFGIAPPKQEYYQIKIYTFNNKSQEERLDKYLREAYVPALHRLGIKNVGIFKPVKSNPDFGKKIYMLVPLKSPDHVMKLNDALEKDQEFNSKGKDYIQAPYDNAPYDRIESVLLKAFMAMPKLRAPNHPTNPAERVYELRSYESSTENLHLKKVHMFNQGGEAKIFEKLQFNAVFYGQVLSGSQMPNLMYMTTFANMDEREKHWNAFRSDPDWVKLRDMEEYKNTVSKANIYLLHPTDYSDI